MNKILIQPNYNNAVVKIPTLTTLPTISIRYDNETYQYIITINPQIEEGYCYLTIKLDDEIYDTVKINSNYSFNLTHTSGILVITLEGYYMYNCYKKTFSNIQYNLTTNTICSEATLCSEDTYCNDIQIGGTAYGD